MWATATDGVAWSVSVSVSVCRLVTFVSPEKNAPLSIEKHWESLLQRTQKWAEPTENPSGPVTPSHCCNWSPKTDTPPRGGSPYSTATKM